MEFDMKIIFNYWMGSKLKDLPFEQNEELTLEQDESFMIIITTILSKGYQVMLQEMKIDNVTKIILRIDDKRFTSR